MLFITVKVFKPKKSNLIRPAFSAEYISNWVEGNSKLAEASLYNGTTSVSFLSAITTPAACVATLRFKPSNFKDKSVNFLTLVSSLISFCNLGSPAMHWVKDCGLDGSKGIILEMLSTNP